MEWVMHRLRTPMISNSTNVPLASKSLRSFARLNDKIVVDLSSEGSKEWEGKLLGGLATVIMCHSKTWWVVNILSYFEYLFSSLMLVILYYFVSMRSQPHCRGLLCQWAFQVHSALLSGPRHWRRRVDGDASCGVATRPSVACANATGNLSTLRRVLRWEKNVVWTTKDLASCQAGKSSFRFGLFRSFGEGGPETRLHCWVLPYGAASCCKRL